jgi:pimeloyl-ACP methyl ester carboxylesterase
VQSKQVQLDDCYIHYVESQQCSRPAGTIVFLHGFPENWHTWRKQIDYFSQSHRVIAPDLPGYHQSSKPASLAFYQLPNLINIMARFVQMVSDGESVTLVAHDWGGAIAWPLVAFHKDLFTKLVILNAAHPSTFTREMLNNPIQRQKSDYIHELIAENAEQIIIADNYQLLQRMFNDLNGEPTISAFEMDEYKQSWKSPGVLTSMLNYYRAMPQLVPRECHDMPKPDTSKFKIPQIHIEIPTLVLWGEQDLAFVPELLDGLHEYVNELTIARFKTGNHWIHHQFAQQVNLAIEQFICPQNAL